MGIERPDELLSIGQQLSDIAKTHQLTGYQIAQIVCAETDPDNKTFHQIKKRFERWLSGQNLKAFEDLERYLWHLDYEVKIVKRGDRCKEELK